MTYSVRIKNEQDTKEFGLSLARVLKPGDIIALIGNLGTGKTTLTKFIAEGLGITEVITSPTFTIVQEYTGGRLPLYHFDVYRIGDSEEMYELGYEEYFFGEGVCVIEWADLIMDIIPEESIIIRIDYAEEEHERIYQINTEIPESRRKFSADVL